MVNSMCIIITITLMNDVFMKLSPMLLRKYPPVTTVTKLFEIKAFRYFTNSVKTVFL